MNSNNSNQRNKSTSLIELCKENFNFLIAEYGFSIMPVPKSKKLHKVVFQNKTTAVIVNWERNENWIYVELYRLVNGKLVIDPIIISDQTELNGYHLDNLLSIRSPEFSPQRFPVDDQDFILKIYSNMLRQYAADVLNGDFRIFDELEKIVKRRIDLNIQKDEPN